MEVEGKDDGGYDTSTNSPHDTVLVHHIICRFLTSL